MLWKVVMARFALTLLTGLTMLCILFSLLQAYEALPEALQLSALVGIGNSDGSQEQVGCRSIHRSPNQCNFLREHCTEEAQTLIPFLNLYYCIVPGLRFLILILLLLWLITLFSTMAIAAGDFLCVNLGTIVHILGMSETLAGVTIFAFGNGSSDLFSTFAAMESGSGSLAIGELFGAACFITAVVAGAMAIVHPFRVVSETFVRDVSFFIVAASVTLMFISDGELGTWECAVIIALYVFYVLFVLGWHWYHDLQHKGIQLQREHETREETPPPPDSSGSSPSLEDSFNSIPDETLPLLATSGDNEIGKADWSRTQIRALPSTTSESSHSVLRAEVSDHSTQHFQDSEAASLIEVMDVARSSLPHMKSVIETLFPTLTSWPSKRWWEKVLAILNIPGVFLLTITVPVVESPRHDHPEPNEEDIPGAVSHHIHDQVFQENYHGMVHASGILQDPNMSGSFDQATTRRTCIQTTLWQRWPTCLQLTAAPLLLAYNICTLFSENPTPRHLLLSFGVSLLVSLICISLLAYFTSPFNPPPSWLLFLSLPGFILGVIWIALIANEIVATLEALGIILSISDALLGLTIFAIGNSCNDLVADISVAKRGYPVMALSACFGGPMLNTLLGIGIGGLFMTLKGDDETGGVARPGFYRFRVSKTLFASGGTLLLGLVGLLVCVPLNGWRMDRKIGWTLIGLWVLSTSVSVMLEITGT